MSVQGSAEESDRDADRLLADASSLDRLSSYPEWGVMDRLLEEHSKRIVLALRQRGLGHSETEALRAELEAIEWLRYRPVALRQAVDDRQKIQDAEAARKRRING